MANLETLNDQPIKTGKKISLKKSSFSSVDAIVAFLVKFNPAVESLDFSEMKNLQSKCQRFHVASMLQSDVITISALPTEIGNLQKLEKLWLDGCTSLEGK